MGMRTSLIAVTALACCFWIPLFESHRGLYQTHEKSPAQIAQRDQIDAYIARQMQSRRIPGLALAVVENGKLTLKKAYGLANLETDTPVKINSIFELASVTKQFTATAIMMLVEESKVKLDEPVSTYIEHTPESWKTMTVRHLLTHTSGLRGAVVIADGSPLLEASTKQQFDFIARTPLLFPPGERAFYSDAGYVLLGMIIEKASGQSYREFMQKRIFDPLQMQDTSILDRSRIIKNRVPTYTLRNGVLAHWRRDWQYEMPSFFGIFSTIEDVAKWDAALRNKMLLKPSSFDQMWSPAKLNNGQEAMVSGDAYGFGWALSEVRGHRTAEHAGASGTYILRFLDDGLTVIVLTNLDNPSGTQPGSIARGIAGLLKPEYQSPDMLTPQVDPKPQITREISALLSEMAEGHDSPKMTAEHRAFYNNMPPPNRQQLAQQLKTLKSLSYIASDEVEGRGFKKMSAPIARISYYKGQIEGRTFYFTFWLTQDSQVAYLRFSPE